ncbi:MAG: hypothetical protein ACU0BF_04910 [Paracoccaceae bacterium]
MRNILAAFAILTAVPAGAADLICNYEIECSAADGCMDSAYYVEFTFGDADHVQVDDLAATEDGVVVGFPPPATPGALTGTAVMIEGERYLTLAILPPLTGGPSTLTMTIPHVADTFTYFGSCKP